jgi:hypothetical protein
VGWVFHAPPGWPAAPPGWVPPAGWVPDPSWPSAPDGWQFWVADGASNSAPAVRPDEHPSWRERRADKHAERDHQQAVAVWQAQQDLADELAASARAADSGQSVDGLLVKKGEVALWAAPCALIEPRVQQGHYVGGYQGVSLHVAKGVNYRIGAARGHYVPGPEVQTSVDQGRAFVTSQRVVFTGARTTREWAYAMLVSVDTSSDDHVALLHVSNRQKVSGLALGPLGPKFQGYLALGVAIGQDGTAAAEQWAQAAAEHRRTQP